MSFRSHRTFGSSCVVLAVAASCSVFPDEATLPLHPSNGGDAGAGAVSAGGSDAGGGMTTVTPSGGAAGEAASPTGGAAESPGGAPGHAAGMGGVSTAGAGGEGGAGAAPTCNNRQTGRAPALEDTWIGSAKSGDNHGSEKLLSVVAGTDEHRLLLALDLPAQPAGARLEQATLRLHLLSNANVDLSARELGLHRLTRQLIEGRATWDRFSNGGNNTWTTAGGDFGPKLASAAVTAGTSSGNIDFDVTEPVLKIIGDIPIPLSLIVRETTLALPPPAELAFASTEGNASEIPELLLVFCEP